MVATSTLTIIVYVGLGMLLVMTIVRRLTKEKQIEAIRRTSVDNITQTIDAYRTMMKVSKALIIIDMLLIPLFIYLYFGPQEKQGILLVVAGLLVLMVIKAFEDIQYRKSVIARLEAEQGTSPKGGIGHISKK
jgi:phosphatidylglycerophosphate synthase